MRREGEVRWAVAGALHCGAASELHADGTTSIRWEVQCECEAKLDARGFLFDQSHLPLWIGELAAIQTSLSCEKLAVSTGEALIRRILKEDATCRIRRLEVRLSPAPFLGKISATFLDPSLTEFTLGSGDVAK